MLSMGNRTERLLMYRRTGEKERKKASKVAQKVSHFRWRNHQILISFLLCYISANLHVCVCVCMCWRQKQPCTQISHRCHAYELPKRTYHNFHQNGIDFWKLWWQDCRDSIRWHILMRILRFLLPTTQINRTAIPVHGLLNYKLLKIDRDGVTDWLFHPLWNTGGM